MGKLGWYLGRVSAGRYQIGRDPEFFRKGDGFSFHRLSCEVPPKLVHELFDLQGINEMKPGEVVLLRKGTIKWRYKVRVEDGDESG